MALLGNNPRPQNMQEKQGWAIFLRREGEERIRLVVRNGLIIILKFLDKPV